MDYAKGTERLLNFGNEDLLVYWTFEDFKGKYKAGKFDKNTYVVIYNLNSVNIERTISKKRFKELKKIINKLEEEKNYVVWN